MINTGEDNLKCIEEINYKKCTICDEWFELNDNNFYKNNIKKTNKIQYHPYCKTCEKIKNAKYTKEHPEQEKIYIKRHYDGSPKRQESLKKLSDKRRIEGKQKLWQQNNPDKIKEYGERYSNKKHIISLKEWEFCKDYFKDSQGERSCAYCGMTEEDHKEKYHQQLHKEHVDCNGEGNLQNCIPSCRKCNDSKHQHNMEEWYKKQIFFSDLKLLKIKKWINKDYKLFMPDIKEIVNN